MKSLLELLSFVEKSLYLLLVASIQPFALHCSFVDWIFAPLPVLFPFLLMQSRCLLFLTVILPLTEVILEYTSESAGDDVIIVWHWYPRGV